MQLRVITGRIDMDGFLGRDAHPEPTDAFKIGTVLEIRNENVKWEFQVFNSLASPNGRYVVGDDENFIDIFIVQLEDGRIVELVEHEIHWIGVPIQAPYDIQKAIRNLVAHNGCQLHENLDTGIWTVIAPDGTAWDFTTPQIVKSH